MALVDGASAALLVSQPTTPIAQLNPDLPDQASRVVRGEVTVTWPYNSVTKTVAFLLAEPDVRLRRAKGQIRMELHGPSAKAVSECGIGAGDELLFSLDGVAWARDVSPGRIPGARLDWQLEFNERLVLQVKFGESGDVKHVNIDRPADEPADPVLEARSPATPEPEPILPEVQSVVHKISDIPATEYPSPAFVKRARLSYGALFEGGFDIFEEDGGVKGKGRKRTRFGRDSSAWRYSSQSPSPEPVSPIRDAMEEDNLEHAPSQPSAKPHMMDEGCQTVEVEMVQATTGPVDAVDATVLRREPAPASPEARVSVPLEGSAISSQEDQVPIPQDRDVSATSAPQEEPAPVDQKEQASASRAKSSLTPQPMSAEPLREQPVRDQRIEIATSTEAPSAKKAEPFSTTLFGTSKPLDSNFSMFGTGAPAQVESSLSIADRVRFGFSHTPQTTLSPVAPHEEPVSEPVDDRHEAYPESYLDDSPATAKYAAATNYLNAADEQAEIAVPGQDAIPAPPTTERFGQGQWEISTQSPHYNQVEGGHFGTDALNEGTRVSAEETSALHANEMAPEKVPDGFASYGPAEVPDRYRRGSPHHEGSQGGEDLAENDDEISGDEVGVDEEEDEDAAYDELAYGERIEEGDYDRRTYDIPDDDDEGLSEEEDEAELEEEGRYGNGEIYDEDGEGEEWDEEDEEEEYDGSEEDGYGDVYDTRYYEPQPSRKLGPLAPPKEKVVISLLSDSEDEDEPVPVPSKLMVANQAPSQHLQEEPASSKPRATPGVSRTAQTDAADLNSRNEEISGRIIGQTHVVDFAAHSKAGGTRQTEVPAAKIDTDTEASLPASQVTGSFEVSNAEDFSGTDQPEPAPSEASSEGLFVSQPRVEYLDAEGELAENSSSYESEGVYEDTEGETEGSSDGEERISARVSPEGELMSVEEVEQDEGSSPQSMEMQGADGSLAGSDDVSFASQVDADEVLPEEDEDMSEEKVAPKSQQPVVSVHSESEIEDVGNASEDVDMIEEGVDAEEDVDMIEAASVHTETGPQEHLPLEEGTKETPGAAAYVEVTEVATEVVSEAVSTAGPVGGTFDGARSTPEREAHTPSSAAVNRELATTEPVQETPAGMPTTEPLTPIQSQLADDIKPQGQRMEHQCESGLQGHELIGQEQFSPPISQSRSDAEFQAQQEQNGPEEPKLQSATENAPASLPEAEHEIGKCLAASDEIVNNTELARSPDMDGVTLDKAADTREGEAIVPNSSIPVQLPAVADMDGAASEDLSVVLSSSQAGGVDHGDRAADEMDEREKAQQPSSLAHEVLEEEMMIQEQLSQELQRFPEVDTTHAQTRLQSPSPDLSVTLARQAVASRRSRKVPEPKKAPEPLRTSPRLTRARSSSQQTNAIPEQEEDSSVSLARAALASPSKQQRSVADVDGDSCTTSTTTSTTTAALKSELTKRLRTELPECVPLKSLRVHVEKCPNVVAIVTTRPPAPPTRAKGGPREYFLSFHVTDPSTAPGQVVEVQLYRPHKESLPVVKPGDAVLLQRFQVKALSKKGFGLRSQAESAWAVFEEGERAGEEHVVDDKDEEEVAVGPPQIRGPPVEDYQGYVAYVGLLRRWFRSLDAAAREKLGRADRRLEEAGR
ncbi:hypothetical protein VTK56DRAFT_1111 [Thermocarpiscus australiensis]